MLSFWATICKTVRPMISDSCLSYLSVCPVCNVDVQWPNGWMDQDETWHTGRPLSCPHCVRWGLSSPSPKGVQPSNFRPTSAVAKWLGIKMPLGMGVGLGPGDFVLDGNPASPPQKGANPPPQFLPMSVVAKWLD